MKKIKLGLLVVLIGCALPSLASEQTTKAIPVQNNNFEDMKEQRLDMTEKELELVDQYRSCVKAAKDTKDLNVCDKNHMEIMREFRRENKSMHNSMKNHTQKAVNHNTPAATTVPTSPPTK